jgi:type IV pilus assembly protein PilE
MRRLAGPLARGLTLVELTVVVALAGILAAIAIPSYLSHLAAARRADAVTALTRLQVAQEQHRAIHGLYAGELSALRGAVAGRSAQGLYRIELQPDGGDAYTARAVALADAAQAGDGACAALTLQVRSGIAQAGPSARCWGR